MAIKPSSKTIVTPGTDAGLVGIDHAAHTAVLANTAANSASYSIVTDKNVYVTNVVESNTTAFIKNEAQDNPGGLQGQIQYNNAGNLAGVPGMTYSANGVVVVDALAITGGANLGSASTLTITGGDAGQLLSTNADGGLVWVDGGAGGGSSVAAPNASVQFNDGGKLGGSAAFTFNKTSNTMVAGNIATNRVHGLDTARITNSSDATNKEYVDAAVDNVAANVLSIDRRAVYSVNGVLPIRNNVTISLGATITGAFADRPLTAEDGTLFVVSGDANTELNGLTFIYSASANGGAGDWVQIAAANTSTGDARYVLKGGDTMTGPLELLDSRNGQPAIPVAPQDAVNKAYVDSMTGSATLEGLDDVTLVDPLVDDQILKYDETLGAWTNGDPPSQEAVTVNFDNTYVTSSLEATTVQEAISELDQYRVDIRGDAMVGHLLLVDVEPTSNSKQATTKSYVDGKFASDAIVSAADEGKAPILSEEGKLDKSAMPLGYVVSVNGATADLNGNIPVSITSTLTGTLDQRPDFADDGTIYIVAGDSTPEINGQTFIWSNYTRGWLEITAPSGVSNDLRYLKLAGGQMQGSIDMNTWRINNLAEPTSAQNAATKNYVDNVESYILEVEAAAIAALGTKVNLEGATMTGPLTLPVKYDDGLRDDVDYPKENQHAATKIYVDNTVSDAVSNILGGGAALSASSVNFTPSGNIESTNVQTALAELDSAKVKRAGDTMTGSLVLHADPTLNLEAATKRYVDAVDTKADNALAGLQGVVTSVNGVTPIRGDVALSLTSTTTGPLGDLPLTAEDGAIYVVSDDPTPSNNGQAFIWAGGQWNALAGFDEAQGDARYLKLSGGTMTGNITMPGNRTVKGLPSPSVAGDAVNKAYADNRFAGLETNVDLLFDAAAQLSTGKVTKAGDTMTGFLALHADPVDPEDAATKRYVDGEIANAENGLVKRDGDTMTGPLILSINPVTTSLQATTKEYVDDAISAATIAAAGGSTAATSVSVLTGSGVTATNAQQALIDLSTGKVSKGGADGDRTMTAPLFLPAGAPTDALHAASKGYVDGRINGGVVAGNVAFTAGGNVATATNVQAAITAVANSDAAKVAKAGDSMTGFLTLNADPTANGHAATKRYVDSKAAGLTPGGSSRVATSGPITLTGPGAAISGVTLTNGDRVLVKDQATKSDNGIYVFNGGSAAMTRATDFAGANIGNGFTTFVVEGTLGGTTWISANMANPYAGGDINFTQFGGSATITGGTGIDFSLNTITNDGVLTAAAGTGISVAGTGTGPYKGAVTITNTGVTSIVGTTNEVTVTGGPTGAVTVGLPSTVNLGATSAFTAITVNATDVDATTVTATTLDGAHTGSGAGLTGLVAANVVMNPAIAGGASAQAAIAAINTTAAGALQRAGGIMTGQLSLENGSGAVLLPTTNVHAAPKVYVDTQVATAKVAANVAFTPAANVSGTTVQAALANIGVNFLPLAGGTLTGNLTLNADPANALHAATKQYVDAAVAAATPTGTLVTLGSTPLDAGETITTIDGLESVTSDTFNGNLTGTASQANLLTTARNFSVTGDVTAPAQSFNGGAPVVLNATLGTVNYTPTTDAFVTVTTDAKGRVTATTPVSATNITTALTTAGNVTLPTLVVQGTTNLGAVGNVTITGGGAGQVLTTNGSNVLSWSTVAVGGTTVDSLNDIGDVNAASPSDGQFLKWDGGANVWVPSTVTLTGIPASDIDYDNVSSSLTSTNVQDALTEVDGKFGSYLPLAGGTVTGDIVMGGTTHVNVATAPTQGVHVTNKTYVDAGVASAKVAANVAFTPANGIAATNVQGALAELGGAKANLTGATFTGNIELPAQDGTASGDNKAATIGYVNTKISGLTAGGTIESANSLAFSRNISLTGDGTWDVGFDGSADVTNPFTLATVINAGGGTFRKVAIDTKGRVSGYSAVTTADITGLVDANYVNVGGDTMTGTLNVPTVNVTANATLGAVANVHITGGTNGQFLQTNGSGNLTWATVSAAASGITFTAGGNIVATDVQAAITELDTKSVKLAGSIMTGALTLSGAPTVDLHAATKKYVDDGITTATGTLNTTINTKVSKAGDTMTGALAMGTNKITGLGAPTVGSSDAATALYVDNGLSLKLDLTGGTLTGALVLPGDPAADLQAATKKYVDSKAAGITPGASCRAATSANINLTPATATAIDATVTLVANDRVLVKDQTVKSENGIYVFNGVGVAMTRPADFSTTPALTIANGFTTFIVAGSLSGTTWISANMVNPYGGGDINFTQFGGSATISGGTGINFATNTITNTGVLTVGASGAGIQVNGGTAAANGAVTVTNTGVTSLAGTDNEIAVSAANGAVTLSLPSEVSLGAGSTLTSALFIGSGANLTNLPGANVTGTVPLATFATTANAVAGANVTGTVASATSAATANAVAGANVTGTVANATFATTAGGATTAGTVTTAVQPNITSVGTLTGLVSSGTIDAVLFDGSGANLTNLPAANVVGPVATATTAGTVTTAAQPNITSVGTLTSLAVTNGLTAGSFTGNGNALFSIQAANIVGTLPILHGGTGQTTAAAAFSALSPITAAGDLIVGTAGNDGKLAIGTAGQVLTVVAGTPAWSAPALVAASAVTTVATPTLVATTVEAALDELDTKKLGLAGGTMTGNIVQTVAPSADNHLITRLYADNRYVNLSGSVMTGNLNLGTNFAKSTNAPVANVDLVNKEYVDNKVASAGGTITIGTTEIDLGETATTLAGLTSVTSTSFVGPLTGAATSAGALTTARNIEMTGDGTWDVDFNGSANVTAALTLKPIGTPVAGQFVRITTDAAGRVTATAQVIASDITAALGGTPVLTVSNDVGIGVSAGTGTGNVVVKNTGVTSIVAGNGVSINQGTGPVTVTNDGVTSVTAGAGINVSATKGAITISADLTTAVASVAGTANEIVVSGPATAPVLSIANNPTLPGTTTGTFSGSGAALTNLNASNVASGTLGIAYGGTGQTTRTAAFDNLAPAGAAAGTIMWYNGTNWVNLGVGTDGQILGLTGTTPTWKPLIQETKAIDLGNGGTINCAQGTYFHTTIGGGITVSFQNVPAAPTVFDCTLEVICNAGGTITWPASVRWPGGIAPSVTQGKRHLFMFSTRDGGATWYGTFLTDF